MPKLEIKFQSLTCVGLPPDGRDSAPCWSSASCPVFPAARKHLCAIRFRFY